LALGLTRVGWACPEALEALEALTAALTALKPMSAEAAGHTSGRASVGRADSGSWAPNCPVRRAPTLFCPGICSGDRERDQGGAHRHKDPATRRDASWANVRTPLPSACAHPTGSRALIPSGRPYHRHLTSLPARLLARRTASTSTPITAAPVAIALRSASHSSGHAPPCSSASSIRVSASRVATELWLAQSQSRSPIPYRSALMLAARHSHRIPQHYV
jgi:hypothetical protein